MGDKWDETRVRHVPLLELATRQHGVVSTRQLKALGYGRNSASKANRVGRLRWIYRGVYAVGHTDLTRKGRVMAAALACQPAVVSHWTAGWLHGLFQTSSTFHLVVPSRRRTRRPFVVHVDHLAEEDVTVIDSIPATSIFRTLLDLAPLLEEERRLAQLLKRTEELGYFDLVSFEALLARTQGHAGGPRLRKALAIYQPDLAVTRSNLEREFRELVRRAGLPMPAANVNVCGYEIDAWWEEERFGVELDVYATHGSRLSFEEDRERSDDLLSHGIEVTRITDKRLERDPPAVMQRLRGHLERRRRQGTFN